jgi:hypothetical protein
LAYRVPLTYSLFPQTHQGHNIPQDTDFDSGKREKTDKGRWKYEERSGRKPTTVFKWFNIQVTPNIDSLKFTSKQLKVTSLNALLTILMAQ